MGLRVLGETRSAARLGSVGKTGSFPLSISLSRMGKPTLEDYY